MAFATSFLRLPESVRLQLAAATPRSWWLGHGIEPYPLAFQTSTLLPSSSRAKLGGRCETRTRISRLPAVGNPLIRTALLGRDEKNRTLVTGSHNPVPKPFGQSRHKTWSWSSDSEQHRLGEVQALCRCHQRMSARPAKLWSWHAAIELRSARLPCACSSR